MLLKLTQCYSSEIEKLTATFMNLPGNNVKQDPASTEIKILIKMMCGVNS